MKWEKLLTGVCRNRTKNRVNRSTLFVVSFISVSVLALRIIYSGYRDQNSRSEGIPKKVAGVRQVCTGRDGNCDKFKSIIAEIYNNNGKLDVVGSIPPLVDFVNQPCVGDLTPSVDLADHGECVRTVRRSFREVSELDSECVNLTVHDTVTPICIYNTTQDTMVSAFLRSTGSWETPLVSNIVRLLDVHKDSVFLDLGCNVGAYTLAAAKTRKHVISVDPLLSNLELLTKSLYLGNLTENVTLVWNAVSLDRSTVTLKRYTGNVGGTAIKEGISEEDDINESVNTIKLDDIQELFIGKPAIVKMDVETEELNTLLSGELFFQTVDVRLVLMEFYWHRNRTSGFEIITFLEGHGFKPFEDSRGHMALNITDKGHWPGEVFFLKQEYFQDFLINV